MGKKPTLNTREVTSSENGRLTDKYTGMTGAEIFHEMLQEHDVKVMFGYTGGAVLALLDAIYQSPHFRFILPRHEQGAGHMAQGYARASGEVGHTCPRPPTLRLRMVMSGCIAIATSKT